MILFMAVCVEDFVMEVFGAHVSGVSRVFVTFEVFDKEAFVEARVVHEHLAFWPLYEYIKFFHCCSVFM